MCALPIHYIMSYINNVNNNAKKEATMVCSLFLHYNFLMRTLFAIEKSVKSSSTQAAQLVLTSPHGVL